MNTRYKNSGPAAEDRRMQKTAEPVGAKPTIVCTRPSAAGGHLSIYIDETWPGHQNEKYKDIGVIGGVVVPWEGVDEARLPTIATHLDTVSAAGPALDRLLAAEGVLPFVFPIKLPGQVASNAYFELVQDAILLLLGWVVPPADKPRTVDIYLEHIGEYVDGRQETDFIRALTALLQKTTGTGRFKNLVIRNILWTGKTFAYVPYGDLVCKTCVPRDEHVRFAAAHNLKGWPGYVPFSPTVFPHLQALDDRSPSGVADHLVAFARVCNSTVLYHRILRQTVERATREPAVLESILQKLEACYLEKNRDIASLNRLVSPFLANFSVEDLESRPRVQLLRLIIELQHANHNGHPAVARDLVQQYRSRRNRFMEIDREFCAEVDANLIVHHHDLFDFRDGLAISQGWIDDPLFAALPLDVRGKMLSSRGQSLAMLGDLAAAERDFEKALSLFAVEENLYRGEIDQTRVYRALNLLELDPVRAAAAAADVLGCPLAEAATAPKSLSGTPFHEHVLVKMLWTLRKTQAAVADYLRHADEWAPVKPYHPYELILFYRVLLLAEVDKSRAQREAQTLAALFKDMGAEGVIGLIEAYTRVILKRIDVGCAAEADFQAGLDLVAGQLPAAADRIATLRQAWDDPAVGISYILPFNYK